MPSYLKYARGSIKGRIVRVDSPTVNDPEVTHLVEFKRHPNWTFATQSPEVVANAIEEGRRNGWQVSVRQVRTERFATDAEIASLTST